MNCIETLFHTPHVFVGNTRRGDGIDTNDPYAGFSLCHYVEDNANHIEQCRHTLCHCLGIENDALIVPRQVHGIKIAIVDRIPYDTRELEGTDAVITNLKEVAIGVNTADCVPIILIDEENGIIAAVHAGWRGAIADIVPLTVKEMKNLGAKEITAFIGPSICSKCFEVGEEVASLFPKHSVIRDIGIKPHIDLHKFILSQFEALGVKFTKKRIPCTRCSPEHYFSARAQGIHSGRNFSFAMLF